MYSQQHWTVNKKKNPLGEGCVLPFCQVCQAQITLLSVLNQRVNSLTTSGRCGKCSDTIKKKLLILLISKAESSRGEALLPFSEWLNVCAPPHKAFPRRGPEKATLLWQTQGVHTHNARAGCLNLRHPVNVHRISSRPPEGRPRLCCHQETRTGCKKLNPSPAAALSQWEEKETSRSFTISKRPASFTRQVNKFSLC